MKGHEGAMKQLVAPYDVRIEVTSIAYVSDEEWISAVYNVDDLKIYGFEGPPPTKAKERASALLRALKHDDDPQQITISPIQLMIEFCTIPSDLAKFRNTTIRANALPLHQQITLIMAAVDTSSASSHAAQKAMINAMFPDQHYSTTCTEEITVFQAVLSNFREQCITVSNIYPIQWTAKQIALSLMLYTASQTKPVDAMWRFIHFLKRFCISKRWNGKRISDLWSETAENEPLSGIPSLHNHFGERLAESICSHFGIKLEPFQNSTKLLALWYEDALKRSKLCAAVLWYCSVEDIVSLFVFEAEDDDDDEEKESAFEPKTAGLEGVFRRFEKREEGLYMQSLMETGWKDRIVQWIRKEEVDGEKLTVTANEKLVVGMKLALNVKSDQYGSMEKLCALMLDMCRESDVANILRIAKKRQVTRFDALKQYLVHKHGVDEQEIDTLNRIVRESGYESETLLLSEQCMTSGKAPWNQLECAPFIASFLRERPCTLTLFLCILTVLHLSMFVDVPSSYLLSLNHAVIDGRFAIGFDIDVKAVFRSVGKMDQDDRVEAHFMNNTNPQRTPNEISFRQNRLIKDIRDCDTAHLLYLLQIACDLHRQWVIERNQYFESISRADRFIDHVDAPQLINNLLRWHNEDERLNIFDGEEVSQKRALVIVEKNLCGIGTFFCQMVWCHGVHEIQMFQ